MTNHVRKQKSLTNTRPSRNPLGYSVYNLSTAESSDHPSTSSLQGVGLSRSLSQHGRTSSSLLNRLKHPGMQSPSASPTSSEGSSRDTRSERTLAHSASSGSIKIRAPDESPAGMGGKKKKGGSGFIAQFLRGPKNSPSQQEQVNVVGRFVRTQDMGSENDQQSGGGRSPVTESSNEDTSASGSVYQYYSGHCDAQDDCSGDQDDVESVENQPNDTTVPSQPDYAQWYDNPPMDAHFAAPALPVYQPIDMNRLPSGYVRATRPLLPDARMLAPMASLADVLRTPEPGEFAALSNRELRFAVENHMLVDQHRYLIRDLGHARAAIAALKQVVQAKEERVEQYEVANNELQQRVAMMDALLSVDQRRQLACMSYTQSGYESMESATNHNTELSNEQQVSEEAINDQQRRVTRPLSGYATGYAFSDKPVHQLPRVFSGDYSVDVQAMETSVGALASVIQAMPRDEHTVADIIASKADAEQQQQPHQQVEAKQEPHRGKQPSVAVAASPSGEHKRRSRFFAALRLSGFSSQSDSDTESNTTRRSSRRSVSLGNNRVPMVSNQSSDTVAVAGPRRVGSEPSSDSLVSSCPVLTSSNNDLRPRDTQVTRRQLSSDSMGSSGTSSSAVGRYPVSLGLNSSNEGSVRTSSQTSSVSGKDKSRGLRFAHRLSFTPQRRSTSAPSRPQSMQVSRRRSWLSRLFDSSNDESPHLPSSSDDAGFSDDDGHMGGRARRRRVLTQSSDEVSRFLGRLALDDNDPGMLRGHTSRGTGGLEDVIDVSGEDEERAARTSLSVAEIRQQTLDALNGTVRSQEILCRDQEVICRGARVSSLPQPQQQQQRPVLGTDGDLGSGRWRQREATTALPTIRRLSSQSTSSASSSSSLGLGVISGNVDSGSTSPQSPVSSIQPSAMPRRASSDQPAANVRSHSSAQNASDNADAGKKWAPAFWAPPSGIWAPEDGNVMMSDGSIGRLSDGFRSPRSSISRSQRSLAAPGNSNSPWELVKLPTDSRAYPTTSTSTSTTTSPSNGLGFFEEPPVPDSDELTMAARRSLSLRMSRTAFRQAEPLPETDDSEGMPLAVLNEQHRGLASSSKRKSLLWQFTSRSNVVVGGSGVVKNENKLERGSVVNVAVDNSNKECALVAASNEDCVSTSNNSNNGSDGSSRVKKWWSAVLG
ncbi:hypothetical protein LPJ57_000664 [Coemansia sp. RSA 486]|nr:hypothetical protein LPJ57_000664 [Coemansia sp. RSA 486]KAJ2639294.1 hypothetical protein GGF40_000959 [Coemansia sp. RSA 1286]